MLESNGNAEAAVEAIVFRAIDSVNELLSSAQRLPKSRSVPLLDDGSAFDSLAVINLLVFIEDGVRDSFGREIALAGEEGESPLNSDDLKTLGSLIDALRTLLANPAR
jgi:hypothetical protein